MVFKTKAIGIATAAFAATALGLATLPASALDVSATAYYAAGDGHAKRNKAERRSTARADRGASDRRADRRDRASTDRDRASTDERGTTDRDGKYTREVDRSKDEDGVSRTSTVTNTETGNTLTRERSTSYDEETGTVTHSDDISTSGGKSLSVDKTLQKTDDGLQATTTVTGQDGQTVSRTTELNPDPESQTLTKSVTTTTADGDVRGRETTMQRTEDGYTRTTDWEGPDGGGVTTEVEATYNEETGTYDRDVSRSRDGDGTVDGDSTVDENADESSTSTED